MGGPDPDRYQRWFKTMTQPMNSVALLATGAATYQLGRKEPFVLHTPCWRGPQHEREQHKS